MLILIDGLDMTGKNSLADRLAGACSPPAPVLHHRGKPTTGNAFKEYCWAIEWYRPQYHDLIVDRCYISELVWPEIFGRPSTLSKPELGYTAEHIRSWFRSKGAVYVHAQRESVALTKELVQAGEPLEPKDVRRAEDLYWRSYTELKIAPLVWDYGRFDQELQDTTFELIMATARFEAERARHGTPPA